jgi:uncharacterized protein YggE
MNKIVRIIGITALAALLFTACSGTTGATPAASSGPAQLSVTGIGQVLVVPDIAFISVGVRTQDVAVSEAIAANNTQAQQIKDTLIAEGVSESDIQTSSFYVYQNYNYDFQGIQTDYYYVVENTVYVTVRDIGSMGGILDAVGRSGANNIYGVTFDVADKTAAQSTARELAVQAAKAQAEELASAAGVELGELLSITSYSTTTMQDFSGYGMGGGGAASVPISSGEMPINAEVSLTYAIK